MTPEPTPPAPPPEPLPTPHVHAVVRDVPLELGGVLRDVHLRGHVYGAPLGTGPVYVLAGGITADALPLGDGTQPGWWQALADVLDLTQSTVLAPGTLGNVSDWPELRAIERSDTLDLPRLTPLDMAQATELWLQSLEVPDGVTWLGASVGGLVGLGLAVLHPARVGHLVTISAGHRPDGWGTGVRHLQRELVRDALRTTWLNQTQREAGIAQAMNRARQLGMLSYRGRDELNARFGRLLPDATLPPIAGYLEHTGQKFAQRFSPQRYLVLSDAIDRFHLGEGVDQLDRLRAMQARVTVVGVPSDLLFPWALQAELHKVLEVCGVHSALVALESPFGHDAFLADQEKLVRVLVDAGCFGVETGVGAGVLRTV